MVVVVRADLAGAAVDVVAGDGDVVGGRVPRERDAVGVADATRRLPGSDGAVVSRRRRCVLVVDGRGDGVGGEQGAAVVERAHLEGVCAVCWW